MPPKSTPGAATTWRKFGDKLFTMAGNIKVIEAASSYQKVSKGIIFDKGIDPYTLGMYVKVIALGKEWDLNIIGFASYLGITESKVRRAFSLLEQSGYLRRIHLKDPKTGRFTGWDYEVGVEPFPEEERTNLAKTQPLENPKCGKPKGWDSQTLGNQQGINKEYKEIKTTKEVKNAFNFKDALLGLGVPSPIVEDWMEVRRKKNAVNTESAFKYLLAEINKSGLPASDCIRIAAENSWKGFKAEYLQPRQNQAARPVERRRLSPEEITMQSLARLQARDGYLHTFTPDEQ